MQYCWSRCLNDPSSGIDNVAAVILECVQGEGGLNVASAKWAQDIARVCRDHGILLIVDDIQDGCGRTGPFFSFETLGIVPDIVTLSKSLSGFGIPMAMTMIRPDVDIWEPGEHTGTFRGNAHAMVTGRVMLEKFWSSTATTVETTAQLSARVTNQLGKLAERYSLRRKGCGLLQGVDMGTSTTARKVQTACLSQGLLLECCGPSGEIIKVMPPLTIPLEALNQGLSIVGDAVSAIVTKDFSKPAEVVAGFA